MGTEAEFTPIPPDDRSPGSGGFDLTEGMAEASKRGPRPFLQVLFTCANAYQRVFRSQDAKRYLARCPKCGREIRFQVGQGGTDQRVFEVSCT